MHKLFLILALMTVVSIGNERPCKHSLYGDLLGHCSFTTEESEAFNKMMLEMSDKNINKKIRYKKALAFVVSLRNHAANFKADCLENLFSVLQNNSDWKFARYEAQDKTFVFAGEGGRVLVIRQSQDSKIDGTVYLGEFYGFNGLNWAPDFDKLRELKPE